MTTKKKTEEILADYVNGYMEEILSPYSNDKGNKDVPIEWFSGLLNGTRGIAPISGSTLKEYGFSNAFTCILSAWARKARMEREGLNALVSLRGRGRTLLCCIAFQWLDCNIMMLLHYTIPRSFTSACTVQRKRLGEILKATSLVTKTIPKKKLSRSAAQCYFASASASMIFHAKIRWNICGAGAKSSERTLRGSQRVLAKHRKLSRIFSKRQAFLRK